MKTPNGEALAPIIKRAILEALNESLFPTYTTVDLADIFKVSPNTVLSWRRQGLLKARVHLVSGCAFRWLFTHKDVVAFFEAHFPSLDDVDAVFGQGSEFNPKTSKARQMQKMLAMRKLYARTHSRRKVKE